MSEETMIHVPIEERLTNLEEEMEELNQRCNRIDTNVWEAKNGLTILKPATEIVIALTVGVNTIKGLRLLRRKLRSL